MVISLREANEEIDKLARELSVSGQFDYKSEVDLTFNALNVEVTAAYTISDLKPHDEVTAILKKHEDDAHFNIWREHRAVYANAVIHYYTQEVRV